MTVAVWVAIFSILVTFSIFLANVIYRTGHLSARVEALEVWRANVRNDMHEISDKLEVIVTDISKLTTLVDERTNRRHALREE
jgi:hypothetical protein